METAASTLYQQIRRTNTPCALPHTATSDAHDVPIDAYIHLQMAESVLVKVIVLGDSGVGKSNLITRLCQDSFSDSYTATIGVDFKLKTIVH